MSSIESPTAAFRSQRVLLVDADADADADAQASEVLATLLRLSSPGVTTASAHGSRAAAALAQEFRPDVAIIDLGSRTASGAVCAGAVLAGCAGSRPLMIALMANHPRGDGIEPSSLFDHVLPKPLELRDLMILIAKQGQLAWH